MSIVVRAYRGPLFVGPVLPGIPTPRLIESRPGSEAYFVPNEDERSRDRLPGVWYLREDPRYVSPTGEYTRVVIESVDEVMP